MKASPDAGGTETDVLAARIAELEAENAVLRGEGGAAGPRRRARSALSAALIVVGLVLGTLSVVTGYAKNQLTDTELFVGTLAPLAADPAVISVVSDAVAETIHEHVDVTTVTAPVFDGLAGMDLPPRALTALQLLQGPVEQGLRSFIDDAVDEFVASDAFAQVWASTVRVAHSQLVATMSQTPDSALTIEDGGVLRLQLGPVVAEVRERLIAGGVGFAEAIPPVDRSIVLVQDESLDTVRSLYALVVLVGTWLPWAALALLVVGVVCARERRRAVVTTTVAAAVLMGVLALILTVGRVVIGTALVTGDGALTTDAVHVIYDAVVAPAAGTTLAIGVLAVSATLVAWLAGPGRVAGWIRDGVATLARKTRVAGERRGISTGETGRWLDRRHALVLTGILTVSASVIVFSRPLSAATVVSTVLVAAIAVIVLQFLRRPVSVPTEEFENA